MIQLYVRQKMKMKQVYLLLLPLLCVVPVLGGEAQDPFRPGEELMEWIVEGKPLLLEFAYGEYEGSLDEAKLELLAEGESGEPEFLSSLNRIRIATSPVEYGEVEEVERYLVRYRISEKADGRFDLRIYLKTMEGGMRRINTDFTLSLSEWIVLGGLSIEGEAGVHKTSVIIVRVVGRDNRSIDE